MLKSKENMDSVLGGAEDLVTKLMERAMTCCLFCFGCLAVKFDLPAFERVPTSRERSGEHLHLRNQYCCEATVNFWRIVSNMGSF